MKPTRSQLESLLRETWGLVIELDLKVDDPHVRATMVYLDAKLREIGLFPKRMVFKPPKIEQHTPC